MPFTFSHLAIILPLTYLQKKWFSLTGLIVGSLTPDFEYFVRMKVKSDFSHTISGLLWFDLPIGILLSFIFHLIVRDSLIINLPGFLSNRSVVFTCFDWKKHFIHNWLVITMSILIGAASHIFWDSFTHDHGYFVEKINLIPKLYFNILDISFPLHKIIQHLSTAIGSLIIVFSTLSVPKTKSLSRINYKYWLLIIIVTTCVILIRILTGLSFYQYGNVLVTGMSALMIALILTPILINKDTIEDQSLLQ